MLVSFAAAACDSVSISETADMRITADVLGVLVLMPDCLARRIDDLSFFPIDRKTMFHHALGNDVLHRGQEVALNALNSQIWSSSFNEVQRR